MADLITQSDLSDYGITVAPSEQVLVMRLIRSASSAVRDAAGSQISTTVSSWNAPVLGGTLIRLPGLPIQSVQSVVSDDVPVTDYVIVGTGLYRSLGWNNKSGTVSVVYTHGVLTVPDDIVELVVFMVDKGLKAYREGDLTFTNGLLSSITIDDYKEAYATGDNFEAVTPMALPEKTRRWLAKRFGNSSRVVTTL